MKRCAIFFALAVLLLAPAVVTNAQNALPSDVSPDTRNRLPLIKPADSQDPAQQAPARGGVNVAGVQIMSPILRANGYHGIGVQSETPLEMGFWQLPILAAARANDQPYEWSLHELVGVAAGLDPTVIDVVRNNKSIKGLDTQDATVIRTARELFGKRELSAATYAEGWKVFGKEKFINIIAIMADYAATSVSLSAFNQQMPPGWKQFLPLPFTMPDDIHADSRSRLSLVTEREPAVPAFAKPLYGRDAAPRGTGPSYIGMHGGGYTSLKASVGMPMIDVAILVTARELNSQYDWTMNEIAARKDGLDSTVIETIRDGKPTTGLPEKEAALIDLGREVLQKHFVSAETFARADKDFGDRDLVDIVSVMGQHVRESVLLEAFDQQLPEGQQPQLPMAKNSK
jgi:hypothetical protein